MGLPLNIDVSERDGNKQDFNVLGAGGKSVEHGKHIIITLTDDSCF